MLSTFFEVLLALWGCQRSYTVPETPMPPNTILLSQMMRQLSAQPGFTEALLKQMDSGGKKGPALMTPRLIDELRKRILGKDWQGLDRFPGWTMREINPAVGVVSDAVAKHAATDAQAEQYLDLGPYALDQSETVSLDKPSTFPPFTKDGIVTQIGDGVSHGDGPNEYAPEHADSQRLADMLNRLAANSLDGAQRFEVKSPFLSMMDLGLPLLKRDGPPVVYKTIFVYRTAEDLIDSLQATGHTVTVDDARYFANFTHLHYNGQDVMAPFWIDSQLVIPKSGGRHLLIPASHAELEWRVRGPLVNADVSYYFGIDGKAEWRTMDTLDQPWVLRRAAHTYTGEQAVEVTRLAGLLTVAYMHLHAAHPALPFGGYYALGVCQDGVSAIERKLTGQVTLFPNTADDALFNDPRDAEVNAMIAAIPKDREGGAPGPERIFGSLPTNDFNAITIPGLADDLNATYSAWKSGGLQRPRRPLVAITIALIGAMLILLLARRRMQRD